MRNTILGGALLLVVLGGSSCGWLKNTTRSRERVSSRDTAAAWSIDTTLTETVKVTDTFIYLEPERAELRTSLDSLLRDELQEVEVPVAGGGSSLRLQLRYDKLTGGVTATARRNAQAVPVKQTTTTRTRAGRSTGAVQASAYTADTVVKEKRTAVNWNLVLPITLLILGVIAAGYFLTKRFLHL